MKVERMFKGFRLTLSNEGLCVGDKVYPIASGRCIGNDDWILREFIFEPDLTGFPHNPHTILNLNYSDYKAYEVRTDKGYSPIECYYKIINVEKQIELTKLDEPKPLIKSFKWVEVNFDINELKL